NIKILAEVRYREAKYKILGPGHWEQGDFPPDYAHWLRENGNLCPGWGEDDDGDGTVELDEVQFMLMDFTNPTVQDKIADKALALEQSGLYDGIMLDWWTETVATTHRFNGTGTVLTAAQELTARIAILTKIRAKVSPDFLIIGNSNNNRAALSAPMMNGLFMESYKPNYDQPYDDWRILKMEDTLVWADENMRQPRINCLEAWRVVTDYTGDLATRISERDSVANKQRMRFYTAMSLVHSDGYVLFADDNAMPISDHLHNWYDFWDIDLGTPVGVKSQMHKNIDGLFMREYTNGWVVYNRSGLNRAISFTSTVTEAFAGGQGKTMKLLDKSGEIYLKHN
ncbi:MAG: hypothetical protein HRU15_00860, partial [Planctomycetes bacterium]|nr:hypothetical protein [Planctomycetota bacterium]